VSKNGREGDISAGGKALGKKEKKKTRLGKYQK